MPTSHYSILILEDSPEDRALYCRYLNQYQTATYEVVEVETASKAWKYLAQNKPDLILLDYLLPDEDGLEFLSKLRLDFENYQIPVIMLTGWGDETAAVQAMKAGAVDYLVKGKLTQIGFYRAIHFALQKTQLWQQMRTQERQQLLLARVLLRIRQFLALEDILPIAVQEIREFLTTDRVIVYQFDSQMNGIIVAESVLPQWTTSLNSEIQDTCFRENQGIAYRDGKIRAIPDIYHAGLTDCHINLLEQFEVRANLVVPILLNTELETGKSINQLWGLLIAHQCSSTRDWQTNELNILQQLSVQLAVAIKQAQLFDKLQNLNASLEQKVKQRTSQLQASEQRFRAIFNQSFQFAGLLTTKGIVLEINQTALDFLGQSLEDIINQPFWEARWWRISDATQDRLKQAIALAAQGEFIRYEVEVFNAKGQIATIDFSIRPVKDKSGQVVMLIPEGRDISDRKKAEQERDGLLQILATQNQSLEAEVIRRTTELQAINEQLATSNAELARATRLKDEFLANMSHELRTPLNAILGLSEGLQSEIFGAINEKQRKNLQTIERSGEHLLELINDILDLSKIEAGQMELYYNPVAISQLCESCLVFIKQQAQQKNIQLELKIPSQLPKLSLDERRIRQVLINLLNNAVKFTPEGGRITLEVSRHTLQPQMTSQSNFIRIAVIDTGIGIAEEDFHKLFQPFTQIDSTFNRQYAGTGLGLALVQRFVELHGGKVGLSSELGVGSCFSVDLPCDHLCETTAESFTLRSSELNSTLNETVANSPLILLAEDNEANIVTIAGYLEAIGYEIILAKNGQDAIALTKTQVPDLILMDIQMPGLDGIEAIKQIRLDQNFVNTPIIALTALAMPGDREKCLAPGANVYIAKPIKLSQLATIIKQLLRI